MIAVGVDTHKHQHLAVAVNALGQLLAEITITATLAGYQQLLAWIAGLEGQVRVGIEGPAATAPAYANTSKTTVLRYSRSSGPNAASDAPASPTASTHS